MDKFKQLLMVKKLRFAPNSSTPEELSNYFKSQEFDGITWSKYKT